MILLIDDNHDLVAAFQLILKSRGYDAHSISSTKEALDFLAAVKPLPELILLDYSMPEMNGEEFIVELLQRMPHIMSQSKIVGFSSFSQDDFAIERFKKMTAGSSEKPFGIESLITLVQKHLQ